MNEEITFEAEVETTGAGEAEQSPASPVLLLPGHLFFVERIDLPAALEDSEINDFAELSLESLAPFPIEQLYWGFLYSESAQSILLYASYKERLKDQGYKDLESYLWVLPDFATLFGAQFPQSVRLQLESDESCSQISFTEKCGLPQQIIAREPGGDSSATNGETPALRLQLDTVEVSEKGLPAFHFETLQVLSAEFEGYGDNYCKKLTPAAKDLWQADIRDPQFKATERSTRKLTARITRATAYAALFAVFLINLEALLLLGNFWLDSQGAKIAAQDPEVRRIEDKQSLMNKLDQVAQNELRPIAILDALNEVRPQGIYFTDTVAEGQNRIMVDGIANTINELNAYTNALIASGRFELLSDPKILTRGGKTTFSATLDYTHPANGTTGDAGEEDQEG